MTDLSVSLHVLGFAMGIALYVMLGVMAWQERVRSVTTVFPFASGTDRQHRRSQGTPPPLTIATLGLVLSIAANHGPRVHSLLRTEPLMRAYPPILVQNRLFIGK